MQPHELGEELPVEELPFAEELLATVLLLLVEDEPLIDDDETPLDPDILDDDEPPLGPLDDELLLPEGLLERLELLVLAPPLDSLEELPPDCPLVLDEPLGPLDDDPPDVELEELVEPCPLLTEELLMLRPPYVHFRKRLPRL